MDLGQIFTNKNVAGYMTSLFSLDKNSSFLDPCFGKGAFIEALISNGYTKIEGYEIDTDLYNYTKQEYPYLKLNNQDFLNTKLEKKYDGIIMNPPYVRHEKIDDLDSLGISKEKLRKDHIFLSLPSTANLYMYFIIKAIDLLKENGELVVIFPSSWQQAKSGEQFAETLYSKCTLLKQVYISGEAFEENPLVDVVILHLKKAIFNKKPVNKKIEIDNGILVPVEMATNNYEIDFEVPFSYIGTVRRGITTGCNTMYINPPFEDVESKKHLQPIISSPKSIVGYGTKNVKLDYLFVPNQKLEFSSEVQKYIKGCECHIKTTGKPKTLFNKIEANDEFWYHIKPINSEGILFSYFVRDNMKFIYNESNYMARDNFYIIKPNIDVMLASALLNNYYTFIQLESSGKRYGAGLLKLQIYDIEDLMFPDVRLFSDKDLNRLKTLSKGLINTDNVNNIEEITKIIANYTNIDYKTIVNQYYTVKKQRLECSTNEKKCC